MEKGLVNVNGRRDQRLVTNLPPLTAKGNFGVRPHLSSFEADMSIKPSFNILQCHRYSGKNSICPERQQTRRTQRGTLPHRRCHIETRGKKRGRSVENRLEDGNTNLSKPKRFFTNSHGDFISKWVMLIKQRVLLSC